MLTTAVILLISSLNFFSSLENGVLDTELVEARKVLEPEKLFRKNMEDLEIISLRLQKFPDNTGKLLQKFRAASSVRERRSLLMKWELEICPPLRFTPGMNYDIAVNSIWRWEIKHSDKEIARIRELKSNIKQNGFDRTKPVWAIEYRGEILLVNGHHRLAAAKSLGLDKVPVKILTDQDFYREAKPMKRFYFKQAFYRICKKTHEMPDNLPSDLMPKD